jgi:hypothetical protein
MPTGKPAKNRADFSLTIAAPSDILILQLKSGKQNRPGTRVRDAKRVPFRVYGARLQKTV